MVQVLKQFGDDLTRENIMKQAANLDLHLDMMLDGIDIKTSPTDFYPIESMQPIKFDGKKFVPLGPVIDGSK